MSPEDRIFAFEQAYYRFRNELAYRQDMIRCGIDAMLDDVESENMVLLAGAVDGDEDIKVVDFFLKAASEIGCNLPNSDDRGCEWVARHSVKCLVAGLELPDFNISKQVDWNFLVFLIELRKISDGDEKLGQFTDLLGKFVDGRIDDYDEWLDQLCDAAMTPPGKKIKPIVASVIERVARLIAGYSYGAIEMAHHEESLSIVADLLSYNAGKLDR